MNKIVKEHYPVEELPENLREGFDATALVRVTIEVELSPPEKALTLEEIFARRRPPYRSMEDIVAEIRRDRDEWND